MVVEMAEGFVPDLVILDVSMPGKTGGAHFRLVRRSAPAARNMQAVVSQPRIRRLPRTGSVPMTFRLVAICMSAARIGTETRPLRIADQKSALTGSIPRMLSNHP